MLVILLIYIVEFVLILYLLPWGGTVSPPGGSILNTKARYVLKYFNKYGFNNVRLTILILKSDATVVEAVEMEQYYIDTLKPNLNINLVASGSGTYTSMNEEAKLRLRNQRSTPVYIYNTNTSELIYCFESKQHLYNTLNIYYPRQVH